MAILKPIYSVRFYATKTSLGITSFDRGRYITLPLLISDEELLPTHHGTYNGVVSASDADIIRRYSLTYEDVVSNDDEIFTGYLPTSTFSLSYFASMIRNPSIVEYLGTSQGERVAALYPTIGNSSVFTLSNGQRAFAIILPSSTICVGVLIDNTVSIVIKGYYNVNDSGSYYQWTESSILYPLDRDNIEQLVVEPKKLETGLNGNFQFTAKYIYSGGESETAYDISWSISSEAGTNIEGASISDYGLLTLENPNVGKLTITAYSESLGHSVDSEVFIDNTSSGSTPSQGNQYFPGGISGSSGTPQGSYDNTFGPNTTQLIPSGSVGNDISMSGMYTKYLMNQDYLNVIAQFFWEDNIGIQALKFAFGNPIDSIISLISYPFNLDLMVPTVEQNIFFGKYDSLFGGHAITRSSFQIDWGTIPIDFYWGNFLDYAPYTQVQLYLPWGVGFVSIDPNEVMPYSNVPNDFNPVNYNKGSIRVVTNIELDKGACVHNVIGNRGLVIGSYGGVVGKQIPMTALDQSAKMLALLGAASGIGMAAGNAMAGAATGKYTNTMAVPFHSFSRGQYGPNMRQGIGQLDVFDSGAMARDMGSSRAMKAGLASAAALASTPPNYPRAGTFSDATNTMCAQVPYIIISRPSQSVPQNYGHYNGYPSNIYYNKLSMISGYTEISEIHLDNVPGSVEELEELDSMLKGGVLL